MEFTYEKHKYLLELLLKKGYHFCNYIDYMQYQKPVIMRHDIDFCLDKAVELAKLEQSTGGVKSTYYVLVATDFYNIFSKKSQEQIQEILSLGHDIGLHFDEKRYNINDQKELEKFIDKECSILSQAIGKKVKTVSMHRPSKWILENDIKFENVVNSYAKIFFNDFKYLSDSRMYWREDVLSIIESGVYDKMHILTHAFWYDEKEITMKEKLEKFLLQAKTDRYSSMKDNFRDLKDVLEN